MKHISYNRLSKKDMSCLNNNPAKTTSIQGMGQQQSVIFRANRCFLIVKIAKNKSMAQPPKRCRSLFGILRIPSMDHANATEIKQHNRLYGNSKHVPSSSCQLSLRKQMLQRWPQLPTLNPRMSPSLSKMKSFRRQHQMQWTLAQQSAAEDHCRLNDGYVIVNDDG